MDSTRALIPAQRPAESSACELRGCTADHSAEMPGDRSHWADGTILHTSIGTLLIDLNLVDGRAPVLVIHDPAGGEIHVPGVDVAEFVEEVRSVAGTSWAVAR